jgi:uncharacterized protein YprB with RNaseH-like and TPR domain/predicted nuclease with RNAse H fold/dephospho-CoA kinase
MLQSTFIHLDGIGAQRESDLWRRGVSSWSELQRLQERQLKLFSANDKHVYGDGLQRSKTALEARDAEFFAKRLSSPDYYRIAYTFPEATIFLDIETTGLSTYYDDITLVGWSLNGEYGVHIRGQDPANLLEALNASKVIVTFNGSLFDLPFIRRFFPYLPIPTAHIDLRFLCRRAGLVGPQKEIEKTVGLQRPTELLDINGKIAPLLWFDYCRGHLSSLKTLIDYNRADIDGMRLLLDSAVTRLLRITNVPRLLWPELRFYHGPSINDDAHHTLLIQAVRDDPNVRSNQGGSLRMTYSKLTEQMSERRLCVIGIDLTGSERRPSGWCVLRGNDVSTQLVGSDQALIAQAALWQPGIVSIDSPLSLPAGRASVSDDDPNRAEYGITRQCERTLRKRGINVYPCLLPSMQKLTARGIALATAFRQLGIPVIESYPGVVQDIIGLPRKRASLDLLRAGLTDFGLLGVRSDASHDELDAITSALVGYFFWTDQYEALGNDDEDYLIIPDLRRRLASPQVARAIGISGPIAAGKTTAARLLEAHGYHYARFSIVLEKLLRARGVQPSREELQRLGAEIHAVPGQRWLCRLVLAGVPPHADVVVDGLRHPEDHAFFVERFGSHFTHIHLEAPGTIRETRCERAGIRHDAFATANTHDVESNVHRMKELAHVVVTNIETPDKLRDVILRTAARGSQAHET